MSFQKRYRFGEFTLSPAERLLLRGDAEVALIPRYFDLLLLLVERRNEAVSRDEIFDRVWSDVVVSDGALTQAVRSVRRSLGDDAREPRFIRTISRHGYRFVFAGVTEEDVPTRPLPGSHARISPSSTELTEALARLARARPPGTEEEELGLLDAAETVLRSGELPQTDPGPSELARAVLREARWDVQDAGTVPLWGHPGGFVAAMLLLRLRLRRAMPLLRRRWTTATLGGAAAGLLFGLAGGLVLLYGPGSVATSSVLVALPLVGSIVGGLGAFGVAGGLSFAEASARSRRGLALVLLGAAGGGTVGGLAHFLGRFTIEGLFGRDLSPVGGGFEGLVIGAAVGAGYALSTPRPGGGMATPRGSERLRAALAAAALASGASILLAVTGHHLGAMSLDLMAHSFPGSQVNLDPLARLLFETHPATLTRSVISGFEGLGFGFGLVWGLTTRPRDRRETVVE